MSDPSKQSRLKDLIAKAKEQNYLTYAEVNDHLPEDISDPDQVEEIIQMINDLGIQVFEEAPDAHVDTKAQVRPARPRQHQHEGHQRAARAVDLDASKVRPIDLGLLAA